jgi:hypothetical protein
MTLTDFNSSNTYRLRPNGLHLQKGLFLWVQKIRFDPSIAKFLIGEMVDNDHEGGVIAVFPTVDSNCGAPVGVLDPMIEALRNQIASIEDRLTQIAKALTG